MPKYIKYTYKRINYTYWTDIGQSRPLRRQVRREKEARYYYHVSNKNMGNRFVMYPLKDGPGRAMEEPDIARTCVCPTVAQCLSAVRPEKLIQPFVYRTLRKCHGVKPWRVCDAKITDEKWFLTPIIFVKIGTIPFRIVKQCPDHGRGDPGNLKQQRNDLQKILELLESTNLVFGENSAKA